MYMRAEIRRRWEELKKILYDDGDTETVPETCQLMEISTDMITIIFTKSLQEVNVRYKYF